MATQMITLKLDGKFLKEIDTIVESNNYQNRTEFIRQALREKIEDAKTQDAIKAIMQLRGAARKKVSTEEYERNRQLAFEDISRKFK